MNIHPVAYDLIFQTIKREDAKWLIDVIDQALASDLDGVEKTLLDRHNLYLDHGKKSITIEDDFEPSDDGICTMTFDEFRALLAQRLTVVTDADVPPPCAPLKFSPGAW